MSNTDAVVTVQNLVVKFPASKGMAGVLESFRWFWILKSTFLGKLIPKRWKPKLMRPLRGVNLEIREGEVVGILAQNGSGKTTLLNAICGLYPADRGQIRIGGFEPLSPELCGKILKVGPSNILFAEFNAIENIQMNALFFGIDPSAVVDVAKDVLRFLEVKDEDMLRPTEQLSSGIKVKIGLARTLICVLGFSSKLEYRTNIPSVLLFDEPTAFLYKSAIDQFFTSLSSIKKEFPKLIIVIASNDSHNLGICDRLVSIERGKLEETPETLAEIKASVVHRNSTVTKSTVTKHEPKVSSSKSGGQKNDVVFPKIEPLAQSKLNLHYWRWKNEVRLNSFLSFYLLVSLMLPNLVALFGREVSWLAIGITTIGILLTSITRESFRIIDREKGYYAVLDILLLSPTTPLKHFLSSTMSGLRIQFWQAVLVYVILAFVFVGRLGTPSFDEFNLEYAVATLLGFSGSVLFAIGLGTLVSPLPLLMRANNFHFLVSIVPLLTFTVSGYYYSESNLPWGFRHFALINPLTYLGRIMTPVDSTSIFICALSSLGLGLLWFVAGLFAYLEGYKIARHSKRLIQR